MASEKKMSSIEVGSRGSARQHVTLLETNSSHLKMDGWNTIVSFWDGLFSGTMLVSGNVPCLFGLVV